MAEKMIGIIVGPRSAQNLSREFKLVPSILGKRSSLVLLGIGVVFGCRTGTGFPGIYRSVD